mmetsp:Transcript_7392/g.12548  ORF Transcript_7392/g.12548 Transcript_7392/m.12548 type:complete len:882 (-) Transcript_7392:99-2744(-)
MADSNNTTASRDQNIIYESTPDGDIRTIVKDDPNNNSSENKSGIDSDLFQRHLRKSWDNEDYEGLAADKDGGDGNMSAPPPQQQQQKKRHNRHKHNLSVQFFDISISDDITNNKGSGKPNNNSNEAQQKESSSTSTTTPMDVTIPLPPTTTVTADTDPSPSHARTKSVLEVEAAAAYYFEDNESSPNKNDDIANFQKNVHSSWESEDEEEDYNKKQDQSNRSSERRGSFSKRPARHRHNLSVQFTDDSLLGKDNDKGEGVSNDIDDANAAYLKSFPRPPATSMSNREARASQFSHFDQTQQEQQQPKQKPAPPAGIVVPVPIVVRPSSINRKHRRMYSGRSNPAMAHRRVNTRGDSTPTKGETWAPIPTAAMPPPHPNQLPPPPPPHHPPQGHPYPPPYYPQGPPPPHPYGSAPTPPPYDPYYAATQPVDPRYYAPSPHHFNSSPASDAGVNYDSRASPMLYPTPSGGGGQYPPSAQSSPGGYYADQQPPPYAANPYARQSSDLSHTSLDREPQRQQPGEIFQFDKNSALSDRSKENSNDGGNGAAAHHRKQSSLGSFLANSGFEDLFDDVDVGYDSAPDEQQSKRHNKSLSSASFMRSLSSDNFLKDHLQAVVEEKGVNSPYASPQVNSAPNSTADAYRQPYPGYYSYGPPQPTSQWQEPNNYLRHSPIQTLPPSTQQRPLFGGGAIQTQFLPPSPPQQCLDVTTPNSADDSGQDANQKRQRRKCSVPDCPNRVVQGGLCISHGAKRKTCAHPGCEKNVKAKGLCSTHGPARKRCNAEGCAKVAVQGGRCIAHGAKKKVCSYAECNKQAILGGMCKKHHDETHGVVKVRGSRKPKDGSPASPTSKGKPGHERGLSLFTDSAIVDTIISNGGLDEQQKGGL